MSRERREKRIAREWARFPGSAFDIVGGTYRRAHSSVCGHSTDTNRTLNEEQARERRMGKVMGSRTELAFAIAHEVGNHLGGIRLQAHLLDENLDVRALAEASILIDGLAGRSGPLLALLRPLLSDDWKPAEKTTWAHILGRVQKQIEDEGTGGTRFAVELGESASGNPGADVDQMPDHEWLHPLLTALAEATIAHVGRRRFVTFRLVAGVSESTLWIEDNGEAEDVGAWAAARGRPLVVGIARNLVERIGGRVDAIRTESETRIGLIFPS